jgi:hypothetical protein
MADQWYYRLFGEEFGPVPMETLQSLLDVGTLGEADDVRADGHTTWTTVALALGGSASSIVTTATASDSTDDDQQWYCRLLGQELGPLSFEELVKFAENGELSAEDDVRFGKTGKWRKVGSIGRLVSVLPYRESQALRPAQAIASTPPAAGSPPPTVPAPAPSSQPPVAAPARKIEPMVPAVATAALPASAAAKSAVPSSSATSAAAARLSARAESQPAVATPMPAEPRRSDPAPSRAATNGGGLGSSNTSSMSSWSAPSKPMAKPPVKRSSSSRPPTDWGEKLAPLKNPKLLGAIGLIVVAVLLFFGSSLLPSGGADREKLEQLQQILADFRKLRDSKAGPSEWSEFTKKTEEIRKPMAEELEKTANRRNPARQYMLWASRNRLPEMLQNSREKPTTAEEQFEANLYDAAKALGVAKGEPPKGSVAGRPPSVEDEKGDGSAK